MIIDVLLPLRLVSEANERVHWRGRAKRARDQRGVVKLVLQSKLAHSCQYSHRNACGPCRLARAAVVTMTRIGPGKLDSDNLVGSCKAVRDGVAEALGVDDGGDEVEWRVLQEKGAYGVRIHIEPKETGP